MPLKDAKIGKVSGYDADLIIAGAGCAGLSALSQVLDGPARERRVIVIDRDFETGDDRTWSFWGPPDAPFAHLADRRWNRLRVRFPGWETTGQLGCGRRSPRRTYMRVRRRDYDREILDAASLRPNIHFVAQDIVDIRDESDGGVIVLPEGELRAPVVFQSARLAPDGHDATVRHPLRQHFGGWEVIAERPVFDPHVATLMDFDTDQHDGSAFFYVLPEAPDRALVEHTMFSLHPRRREFYDAHIRAHLDRLGAGEITITRREYGSIPMEDRRLDQRWGRHVWNLGTVGGMTKPTTGYTFQRIHAQTRHLVSMWLADGRPTPLPGSPRRYRFADRTLLSILHHHPERGRPIFEHLFRTSSIDDVLSFLDEDTTLTEDARMMSKLPWLPFLRAGGAELAVGAVAATRRLAAA
jgi:lycopene beta-cyclase